MPGLDPDRPHTELTMGTFIDRVIADGIEAAKGDYTRPDQVSQLAGSIAGFEACKGKTPGELCSILEEARLAQGRAYGGEIGHYWWLTGFAAEVEWVCNCVSAVLVNEGQPPIVPVTARGIMKANAILSKS